MKRIYVPLPDEVARAGLIQHLMRKQGSGGGGIVEDIEKLNAVVKMTAGYSGSDLSAVCAALLSYPLPLYIPLALPLTVTLTQTVSSSCPLYHIISGVDDACMHVLRIRYHIVCIVLMLINI